MKGLTFPHLVLGIFAVANNFTALGPFLRICKGISRKKQIKLAGVVSLTALITMIFTLLTGEITLEFFGISINAFKITGGIILGMSGIHMLNAKPDAEEVLSNKQDFEQKIPVAIVPIGIPLTTGAGTISTITIFSEALHRNNMSSLNLLVPILVVTTIIYVLFRYSTFLLDILGNTGVDVVTKVMGIFTLALGTQFIVSGISGSFPGLL